MKKKNEKGKKNKKNRSEKWVVMKNNLFGQYFIATYPRYLHEHSAINTL